MSWIAGSSSKSSSPSRRRRRDDHHGSCAGKYPCNSHHPRPFQNNSQQLPIKKTRAASSSSSSSSLISFETLLKSRAASLASSSKLTNNHHGSDVALKTHAFALPHVCSKTTECRHSPPRDASPGNARGSLVKRPFFSGKQKGPSVHNALSNYCRAPGGRLFGCGIL